MAIVKTKPFLLVGVSTNRKQILEELQILKCSQIEEIENLKKIEVEKTIEEIEKTRKKIETAIEIIKRNIPLKEQKKLNKNKLREIDELKEIEKIKDNLKKEAEDIVAKNEKIKELKKEIEKIKNKEMLLESYKSIDVPLKSLETKNTKIIFGEILGSFKETELEEKLKEILNLTYFKIVKTTKTKTNLFLVIHKEILEKTKKILLELSFVENKIETKNAPEKEIEILKEDTEKIEEQVENLEKEIEKKSEILDSMKIYVDFLNSRQEKYETIKKLAITKNTFILKGFLNPKFEEKIKDIITNKFNSYVEVYEEIEDSPVFFSNNIFVSPVETITKTYSMPSSKDVDPNPIMSFFYYMFFGMMFSDAGYGLILSISTAFFLIFKKSTKEKKNFFRMFFFCGLATTFWGFMYGSFFGDLITTISKTYFNRNISLNPIFINTTKDPLVLLIFSISLGIFQIVVGILIKTYSLIKQKNIKEAVFCNLNWAITLVGIGFLLSNSILKIKILNLVGIVFAMVGAIITLFFSGYSEKGIIKILKGIINLYGITSYISDILSYSRLMALGIATGVIANVVNILAIMGGKNFFGTILFILILIVGHSLNFSINILGAYVHTNRLQYVEFFSKFYTGGGKSFSPFAMHTKYFEFSKNKED